MLNIEIFDPKFYDSSCADELVALIRDRLDEKERCSLVLSGGSTPGGVYRTLGRPPRSDEIDWSRVDLFMGDERWVPATDAQSNLRMVKETLLGIVGSEDVKGPKVYPVNTTLGSVQAGADDYSAVITNYLKSNGGKFDIVLLGLGEDGHTASLFPGSPFVTSQDSVCFAVKHPTDGTQRVTVGSKDLFNAWRVIYLVKGRSKSEMIKRTIDGKESIDAIPARLYTGRKDETSFLLDSEAASLLQR